MNNDYIKKTIDVYDAIASDYVKQAVNHAPEPEREKFIKKVKKGGTILDAGCGSGRDVAWFIDKGFHVVGIDLSEELLKIARKNSPKADLLVKDMRNVDFPNAQFDGIWSCASLLHLKKNEISGVLQSFFRILKPEGVLFILVKSGAGERWKEEPSAPGVSRFYSFFSKEEVEKMLEHEGFAVDDIYTYNAKDRLSGDHDSWWIACFARK